MRKGWWAGEGNKKSQWNNIAIVPPPQNRSESPRVRCVCSQGLDEN